MFLVKFANMKFVVQYIIELLLKFLSAGANILSKYTQRRNDVYYVISGIFLLISLYSPRALIIAFLVLLPALEYQIFTLHVENTLKSTSQTLSQRSPLLFKYSQMIFVL